MATPIPENRARFTLGEVARAVGGRLVGGDPALDLAGVSTDSRSVAPGALFVALIGAAHDGHRFVDAARARGVLVTELTPVRSTLEDVFVDLVKAGDAAEADAAAGGRPPEGRAQ